jgi:pimeloyl-ACP methyl ester carboxylesterase
MAKKAKQPGPADYIQPLNMNGLQGRMLYLPPPKPGAPEILFVYGHHSSLERWWGVVKFLNRYAAVTMPDLPGFGGMDSFYKIGKTGSIDNLADYLASFMQLRYKRKKVVVVGMSLGFVIATRMLQRCPELIKKVDLLVSFAGFAHRDDFTFSTARRKFYIYGARFFSHRLPALFFRYVMLHPRVLRTAYTKTHNAREKFEGVFEEELEELVRFEIKLWHDNEVRTYMKTTTEFLDLDNCRKQVDLPVYHIGVVGDRYFDNSIVEQHFRVIFSDYHLLSMLDLANHAPSVIADEKAASVFIPPKLRRILQKRRG